MLYIKALHLIFIVTWFAGLFYLPRLYVYHAKAKDVISIERFKLMEERLYWGITTPSGVLAIIFGIILLYSYGWEMFHSQIWLHIKLSLVALLVVYHLMCGYFLKQFKYNTNQKSALYFRFFNEFPVLILATVVILTIAKPF